MAVADVEKPIEEAPNDAPDKHEKVPASKIELLAMFGLVGVDGAQDVLVAVVGLHTAAHVQLVGDSAEGGDDLRISVAAAAGNSHAVGIVVVGSDDREGDDDRERRGSCLVERGTGIRRLIGLARQSFFQDSGSFYA